MQINDEFYELNKYYHRNFILTGIPRSGTSMVAKILNSLDNVVCLNEVEDVNRGVNFYDVPMLPGMFSAIRQMLWAGDAIPNRYDGAGGVTSNTMKEGEQLHWRNVEGVIEKDVVIGSKINAPYLGRLNELFFNRFRIYVITRHPVYVIGSYQMPYTATLNIANPLTDVRYDQFKFENEYAARWRSAQARQDVVCDEDVLLAKIHCQAELWNWFAQQVMLTGLVAWRYEDIVADPKKYALQFMNDFDMVDHMASANVLEPMENQNKDKYPHMDLIRDAVKMWCKAAKHFGYEI